MEVCVFGSGAIGGWIGARCARAGIDVSLIARGPHLAAMRANGLTLRMGGEEHTVRAPCTDDPRELGPQDVVIIALKAHSVPAAVESMVPLLHDGTIIVTATNGIPYWYFYRHGGPHEGTVLRTIDPGGAQWRVLRPERAIGCVVYPAAEVVEPGVIEHVYGKRLPVGDPEGGETERALAVSRLLTDAGFDAPVLENVRDEIWLKLWGNLSFNPVSALTHATLERIAADPGTRRVVRAMMEEAEAVGRRLGVHFRVDVERRIDGAGRVGAHKTSMLQDLERGRPMEIDPLVSVVQEMGRLVDVPTPTIGTVLALIKQRAETAAPTA